jgi:hypothetical protein
MCCVNNEFIGSALAKHYPSLSEIIKQVDVICGLHPSYRIEEFLSKYQSIENLINIPNQSNFNSITDFLPVAINIIDIGAGKREYIGTRIECINEIDLLKLNGKYYNLCNLQTLLTYYPQFLEKASTQCDIYSKLYKSQQHNIIASDIDHLAGSVDAIEMQISQSLDKLHPVQPALNELLEKYTSLSKKVAQYEKDIQTCMRQLKKMGFSPLKPNSEFIIATWKPIVGTCNNSNCKLGEKKGMKLSCNDVVCVGCIVDMIKQMQNSKRDVVVCPKCGHFLNLVDLYTIKLEKVICAELEIAYNKSEH